ncbi:hypothetical protein ACWGIB_19360 [Streptomyces xiamenensis]
MLPFAGPDCVSASLSARTTCRLRCSTHHTLPELLPIVLAEFERTLAPGGHPMTAAGWGHHAPAPAASCAPF